MDRNGSLKINSVKIYKAICTSIMLLFSLIWISPILLTLITSIKTDKDVITNPFSLPIYPVFQAYSAAWNVLQIDKLLFNSMFYSFAGTALAIILAIFPAYLFTKFYVPAGNLLFVILLVGLAIPQQTFIIPLYDVMRNFKLLDNRLGIIIVHAVFGLPFELLIFVSFLSNIPNELLDSARIDGGSNLGILRYIIVPLLSPAIAAGFLVNSIGVWKEYFFALIFLNKPDLMPMTVGITQVIGGKYTSAWSIPAAAVIISQIPLFITVMLAYRWIKEGIFSGAVKG